MKRIVVLALMVLLPFAARAGHVTTNGGALAVVGSGSAPQVVLDPNLDPRVTPSRTFDYIDSIGVNAHYGAQFTGAQIASMMNTLGIHWWRDGSYQDGTDGLSVFEAIADNVSGAHMLLGYAPGNCAGIPALTTLVDDMWAHDQAKGRATPTILYLEGPNEVDAREASFTCDSTTGESAGNHAQIDLWNYVKTSGDPAVANVKVVMRPMASNGSASKYTTAPSAVTSCSGICADVLAVHDYMGDFAISNPDGTGSPADWVSLQVYWYRNINQKTPLLPIFPTEFGWSSTDFNGKDSDAATQAIYCLNQLSDQYLFTALGMGYPKATPFHQFIYELFDDNGSTDLGMFTQAGVAKAKANALSNLTTILNDAGATAKTFTTTPIIYTATGFPQDCHVLVLQKSNGTYEFLVWREAQVYNENTKTDVAVPAKNVVFVFGQTFSTIRYYDPINNTTANGTVTSTNTITIPLAGHQLVIEAF